MKRDPKAYSDGVRAAREAIANGVPRWIQTSDRPFGESIDPDTGLPIAHLSAPDELAEWQDSFAQGFNNEIRGGLVSGVIKVDFRPLLMTRSEIRRALDTCHLGTLSPENPRIESPNGDFAIEIQMPKSKSRSNDTAWICYDHKSGERWSKFAVYEGPLEVALGGGGHVLVLKTERLFLTHDIATTQVLNIYLLEGADAT